MHNYYGLVREIRIHTLKPVDRSKVNRRNLCRNDIESTFRPPTPHLTGTVRRVTHHLLHVGAGGERRHTSRRHLVPEQVVRVQDGGPLVAAEGPGAAILAGGGRAGL